MVHKKIILCFFGLSCMAMLTIISKEETVNEFVVTKKKKEATSDIKEDIARSLEKSLRQIGNNIQKSITVQNEIFDTIKELISNESDGQAISKKSAAELKECRHKLEHFQKQLENQCAELAKFNLCF